MAGEHREGGRRGRGDGHLAHSETKGYAMTRGRTRSETDTRERLEIKKKREAIPSTRMIKSGLTEKQKKRYEPEGSGGKSRDGRGPRRIETLEPRTWGKRGCTQNEQTPEKRAEARCT